MPTGELSKLELEVETKLFLLRRSLSEEKYPVGLASNLEELYAYIPRLPEGHPLLSEIKKLLETVKTTYGHENRKRGARYRHGWCMNKK